MSASTLGERKVLKNQGDLHADGDSIPLFLSGVSSNLKIEE